MKSRVFACYKGLLRARQHAFRGDSNALALSYQAIRKEFENNRAVTETAKINELLQLGDDVATVVRNGIIQGELNEAGNYRLRIPEGATFDPTEISASEQVYNLRQDVKACCETPTDSSK